MFSEENFAVAFGSSTSTPPLTKGSRMFCGMYWYSALAKAYPALGPESEERGGLHQITILKRARIVGHHQNSKYSTYEAEKEGPRRPGQSHSIVVLCSLHGQRPKR